MKETLKRIIKDMLGILCSGNLKVLAYIYKTDKRGHDYLAKYQKHFSKLRLRKINLLEIGIGGYENPKAGGNSLRMWKKYFPFGRIHGIDVIDKRSLTERRINIHQGSQTDLSFLESVLEEVLPVTIIIDDGSHVSEDVITTFKFLFPKLESGGTYVVEDMQTSYWQEFEGDPEDLSNPSTSMNFFKQLTDSVNSSEFERSNGSDGTFDDQISSIHFYYNMVVINKK
tara:strand:- start:496 stop:1176 length:681 start_codon:yes stop_codon:yes gene_type:complete